MHVQLLLESSRAAMRDGGTLCERNGGMRGEKVSKGDSFRHLVSTDRTDMG